MAMLNDPNSVRFVDGRNGVQYYLDEVLIPDSVDTKEVSIDTNQLERHWKTELETAVRTVLTPVAENPDVYMMEVVMVKDIFYIYFTLNDLSFSTKNRKKLVAMNIDRKKRD